ncbi:MAG: type VII secretion target [Mycobacterium sp.]|uniref:hypothetical protein n=1 Tax=Mycobacterium sp. TaxID=1785 RepID=UPI003BB01ED9
MDPSTQVPVEELQRVQSKIQSMMDDTHAVVMQAQHANDGLMTPSIFSGGTALASAAKAAEITQAGQQLINSLTSLGDNLGIAASAWHQQAEDGAQLMNSVGLDGVQSV